MRQRILQTALLAAAIGLPALACATSSSDALPTTDGPSVHTPSEPAIEALATIEFPVIETVAVEAPVDPAFGAAVDDARLAGMRGGDGNVSTTTNRADVRGGVNGNTATNVVGGTNLISDGSFGNAAGISTVIQNSGSNVLIQNSTIVNVQFVPTP